ncbi:hypothetical protein [Spirosoma montaniterrae]|uniref:hypothetical protein n=1 Tax=Spirosoma montaniterrae TaxID=1178516 RepID=UPI001E29F63D|nr:hypothetical protein [Spirosoma montaniterrae]
MNFFRSKLKDIPILNSILQQAISEYPVEESVLEIIAKQEYRYENEHFRTENHAQLAALLYQRVEKFFDLGYHYSNLLPYGSNSYSERVSEFMETHIDPIVNFLQDSLEETNFTLYLLEKYKARTEWFKHHDLLTAYNQVQDKQYEQVFDDDLRLFLFDQGIDYPFSTPKSSSGRADIIGNLDSNDPLVLEVKVYDSQKGYRKNRIIDGFAQIVKYANDYNKNVGYLIVFNIDPIEIRIAGAESKKDNAFPNRIYFNEKTYFIVFVNLNFDRSASKLGQLKVETINEGELFQNLVQED